MTLELIETFLTVLKYRNITSASRHLYTSQSTVSHRLRLLEEEVGVPLFIRSKGQRSIEITPGGEAFISVAQRWMSVFRDTNRIKNSLERQTLSIGGTDLINVTMIPLYQQLIEDYPQIQMNIWTHHSSELYARLENREIDIAYVFSKRKYPDILAKPLYKDSMVLLCHKDSPYHDGMRPEELSPDQEIYLKWSTDFELWHDRYWPNQKSLLMVGVGTQLTQYLNKPGRWAIAPENIFRATRTDNDLVCYSVVPEPPALTCYELTHRYPKSSTIAMLEEFRRRVHLEFLQPAGRN